MGFLMRQQIVRRSEIIFEYCETNLVFFDLNEFIGNFSVHFVHSNSLSSQKSQFLLF